MNEDNNGCLYLIQPEEYIGTNIYKIGCSRKNNLSRIKTGYGSNTKYICVMEVDDPFKFERKVIGIFNQRYKLIKGNEYFEGNKKDMCNNFIKIISNYNINYNLEENNQNNKINELEKKFNDLIEINNNQNKIKINELENKINNLIKNNQNNQNNQYNQNNKINELENRINNLIEIKNNQFNRINELENKINNLINIDYKNNQYSVDVNL